MAVPWVIGWDRSAPTEEETETVRRIRADFIHRMTTRHAETLNTLALHDLLPPWWNDRQAADVPPSWHDNVITMQDLIELTRLLREQYSPQHPDMNGLRRPNTIDEAAEMAILSGGIEED